jgi:hypothetical protein
VLKIFVAVFVDGWRVLNRGPLILGGVTTLELLEAATNSLPR